MNLKDLEVEFRRLANDGNDPPLWTHDEIVRYANEAVKDACERAQLIEDSETPTICRITVRANKPEYNLNPLVLRVLRVKLDRQVAPLTPSSRFELERRGAAWESTMGTPFTFFDLERTVRLVWIPNQDDVARLTVKRLPLRDLCNPGDQPEIHDRLHYRLVDGMMARGYMKTDSQTYDPKKASECESNFTRSFGERPDANVMRKRRESRTHVTKPGRYT